MENYRFTTKSITDESGMASLTLKIPGTFNGLDPNLSNGRFFVSAQVWAADQVQGDMITDIEIEDTDNAIPVPYRALFADYPILGYSIDPEIEYDSQVTQSIRLRGSSPIEIGPANAQTYRFLPSGLYLKASFVAGNNTAGREFYANFLWVKK